MHEAAQQLVERLRGVQQRGEAVDIAAELAKVTLEVVGTCAFGWVDTDGFFLLSAWIICPLQYFVLGSQGMV
jgi:hypothetical protein